MSADSKIEWTDATWNVVLGCDRVSPGCDGCYAIRTARRMSSNPNPKVSLPYTGLVAERGGRLDWTGQVNLVDDRLALPLRWARPRRIFVNAQSDLFHDEVSDGFIHDVFAIMAATPQHTYQILTKRHGRMRSLLSQAWFRDMLFARESTTAAWPLPNVHLGVSVEDQKRADLRIPALLDTPAAVRFLSCEPLLGPVDLQHVGPDQLAVCDPTDIGYESGGPGGWMPGDTIDWVIVGGESGPDARPMHPQWARQIRDECRRTQTPLFFKQAGVVLAREWGCAAVKGDDPAEWPETFPQEFPHAG